MFLDSKKRLNYFDLILPALGFRPSPKDGFHSFAISRAFGARVFFPFRTRSFCLWSNYIICANFFPNKWLIVHPCAKAPLCFAQSFSKGKVWICEYNADSVLRKQFCGREDSQNRDWFFWDSGGIRASAPQEGAGGMRGGFFLGFWWGWKLKKVKIYF